MPFLILNEKSCPQAKIGGQAVIEGVMMRAPNGYSVAVRKPDGSIVVDKKRLKSEKERGFIFKLPIARGVVMLLETLSLGIKALNFSAMAALDEEEAQKAKKTSSFLTRLYLAFSVVLAFGIGILIFVILPLWLTNGLKSVIASVETSNIVFNLVDGVIRVIFFVCYVFLISLWKDVRRIFQYHGAEHKVIYTFEAGEPLTVENARPKSTLHSRCGTSFLIIVMIMSILVFSIVPLKTSFLIKFASRIILIPLIAGISYELLKLSSKYRDKFPINIFIMPGLWLQKITTKEPSDDMLEVAIIAVNEAMAFSAPLSNS